MTDQSDSKGAASGAEPKPAQPASPPSSVTPQEGPAQGQSGGPGDTASQMVTPIEWTPSVLREATPSPRRSLRGREEGLTGLARPKVGLPAHPAPTGGRLLSVARSAVGSILLSPPLHAAGPAVSQSVGGDIQSEYRKHASGRLLQGLRANV